MAESYLQRRARDLGVSLPGVSASPSGSSYLQRRAQELGVDLNPQPAQTQTSSSSALERRRMDLGITPETRPERVKAQGVAMNSMFNVANAPDALKRQNDAQNNAESAAVANSSVLNLSKGVLPNFTPKKSTGQRIIDTIQYPFDKAAEALAPSGTFLDGKPDEYGATNPRDRLAIQHAVAGRATTGNETMDKVGTFLGEAGAFFANPAKVPNVAALYNNPLFKRAGEFAGRNVAGESAGRIATTAKDRLFQIAGRTADEATREGLTGAVQGAQYGLTTGSGDPREIANEALEGGAMGILGGAAFGTARGALRNILDNRAARKEIMGTIYNADLPLYQNERTIQQVGGGNVQQQSDNLAGRFNSNLIENRVPEAQIGRSTSEINRTQRYSKELEDAIQQQYDYLKQSMSDRGGVDRGTLIRDQTGEVVNRVGRISNNPKWYQDFYAQYGRQPTNKELRDLAEKQVRGGYQEDFARVPSWKPSDIDEIDQELASIREAIPTADAETRRSLEEAAASLQTSRNELVQSLPEGVIAMRNGGMSTGVQGARQGTAGERVQRLSGQEVQPMQSESIPFREVTPNANAKPISRQELMTNVRKRFNLPLRTGRLGIKDESVLGYYKVNPEVVRSRNHGDIQVISHELGHHLDKRLGLSIPTYDSELLRLGRETSGEGYTQDQVRLEGVAEFIRLHLTDPAAAEKAAPVFANAFQQKLNRPLRRALQATQKDVARWIDQGPAMQLRGQINRTGSDTERSIQRTVDKTVTSMLDRLHPLSVTERAANLIESGKKALSDASHSLYKRARLYGGAPRIAQQYVETNLRPILKSLDGTGYNMKDLGDYATAMHALELEDMGKRAAQDAIEAARAEGKQLTESQIRAIERENRIESGFTRSQIQGVLQKYDSPEMRKAQQDLVKYNDQLLDMMVKGQVISEDAVKAMRAKYKNYVPFYRFFDSDISQGFGGRGFADLTNPVKRLKGSTRDIIDPLESIVKNTFAAVNAVEKNKVGLQLARLADVEGMGSFVERLQAGGKAPKENIVTVFENGERVAYQLDPDLYLAINELDQESSNTLVKMLSYPSSALRAGATLTPEFMLRNPFRDQFQAYVVSEFGYKPVVDMVKGIYHVLGKTKTYRSWVEHGGAYGSRLSMDRNYLREQLQSLKDERNPWARRTQAIVSPRQWMNVLQKMSEVTEEATKVGEFRRGIRKGYSPEEAAYQSRDLMDFGKSGNSIRQVNRVVTFLNANLQGKDRIARAFGKHPVRSTVRALTGITLPTIGAYLWNQSQSNDVQRETIQNAPQWLRDTFFLISIPGTDVVARIPKPFDLAPVWSNPAENAMRQIYDENPQGWGDVVKNSGIELLKVPYMLTGLTPIIENATNYSFFTGGPIVPRRDQDLLPEDQYGVNTSLTSRVTGKTLGVSPYKVDNLIRGYGAGLGKYATAGSDRILEAVGAGRMPPEEKKKTSELPVINAFTVDNTSGGKVMDDFYKAVDKATNQANSNEKNNVEDKDAAADKKRLDTASRTISKLRSNYRDIQGSFDFSPAEKRRQLDIINDKMKEQARKALESIK